MAHLARWAVRIGLVLATVALIVVWREKEERRSVEPAAAAPSTSSPSAVEPATTPARRRGPSVVLDAAVTPDGAVEVVESVVLPPELTSITLAVPPLPRSLAAGRAPRVTDLQAATADGPLVVPSRLGARSRRVEVPADLREVELRYQLRGASQRSRRSVPGRAMITVQSLLSGQLPALPVRVQVLDEGVLNLVCPQLPPTDQLCGRRTGAVWTTSQLAARRSLALVQVDLPAVVT